MTVKLVTNEAIRTYLAAAWPGTGLATEPTPLAGGFWASMFRVRLTEPPVGVPVDVVVRIAPDPAMGAKELAVQRSIAELGFPTPRIRLGDPDASGRELWSVMDFATGAPPLAGLNGIAALRNAPGLFAGLPKLLASTMAQLHRLDAAPVTAAVKQGAPTVAWTVHDVLEHFEVGANALDRRDLATVVSALVECKPMPDSTVVCHGDLHPFNLLVGDHDRVTVIDWTAAISAEPAFDVAFTAMLLANPPLAAPAPLRPIISSIGARIARRFVREYSKAMPAANLGDLDWYRALHGTRMLIEIASIKATAPQSAASHPFAALASAARAAITKTTGIVIET